MKHLRSKNLDSSSIENIVEILDAWSGKLNWLSLIDTIERRMHVRYTRQALHNHERIRTAFVLRKKLREIELPKEKILIHTSEMQAALDRISRLESEIIRLKTENERLLEQFVVWAYNAHVHNVSKDMLSRPLPKVNRGQTKRS